MMNTTPTFQSDNAATAAHPWINRLFLNAVFIVLVLVLGTLGVFLFRPALKPSQLAGNYHCDYPHGVETLTLNSDFTYTQNYAPNSGKTVVNKGTWTMNARSDIELNDAFDFDTGFGAPQTQPIVGRAILAIRRDILGRIFITVNEDRGLEFRPK